MLFRFDDRGRGDYDGIGGRGDRGVVLANMNVEIVAGVTNQMKMIGQNHSHQVNAGTVSF